MALEQVHHLADPEPARELEQHFAEVAPLEERRDDRLADLLAPAPESDGVVVAHEVRRRVEALRTTELEVRTRRPHPINLDGEIGGRTPARFRVLPGALEVFVPAGAA